MQGMGWALMENMAVEGGKIVNDNMLDYVIPTAMDVPEITRSWWNRSIPLAHTAQRVSVSHP